MVEGIEAAASGVAVPGHPDGMADDGGRLRLKSPLAASETRDEV